MDRYTEVIGLNGDVAREFMTQLDTAQDEDRQTIVTALDSGDKQSECADSTDIMVEYGGEKHLMIGAYVVVTNKALGYATVYRDETAMQKVTLP